MDFQTLAARALNSSRMVHKPTYAGLRLLFASMPDQWQGALTSFLESACQTRDDWRYFSFQALKEASRTDHPVYRDCLTASPLTVLAETHVLGLMAADAAFRPPPCAYSYLWPASERTGRNFEFFMDGYERRRKRVSALLDQNPGCVAVVADIKAFYLSVDKDRLRAVLAARVATVADPSARRSIERFLSGLIDLQTQKGTPMPGIPIGPDASHVLGHLALAGVDSGMAEIYGERYLRYVDDIVVVCPVADVDAAVDRLRELLACENLKLNDDKTDVVERPEWQTESGAFTRPAGEQTFESLVETITLYLLADHGRAKALQARLRAERMSLPVARLSGLVRSSRYRAFARGWLSGLKGWWARLMARFVSETTVVETAIRVRDGLWEQAERMSRQPPPPRPMRRRWYVQRRRYVYNRLLYLLPPEGYKALRDLIPDIDEFAETRIVIDAVTSGDAGILLKYPGRVASAFCQLWQEHHPGRLPQVDWPECPARAEGDTAAHFALHLGLIPPATFLDGLAAHAPGARALVDLCERANTSVEGINSFSFLGKMKLLFQGKSHEEVTRLMSVRFDELEEAGLEGLFLGGSGSPFPWDCLAY